VSPPPPFLFTCEHASNRIPELYQAIFQGREVLLASHRGYDIGALELARRLAAEFGAPLIYSDISRLVVELNRSIGHPKLFSEVTARLSPEERQGLLDRCYRPHHRGVARVVSGLLAQGGGNGRGDQLLHVAAHSFTPALDGVPRNADVGLLYDPARPSERAFCAVWRDRLADVAPGLAVRRNSPYRGASDGLTRILRAHHPDPAYIGVELEANQRFYEHHEAWKHLGDVLAKSLRQAVAAFFSE
jgi:predicted N-formylglutamate amidohydrolase